jgi:hypothetical protein
MKCGITLGLKCPELNLEEDDIPEWLRLAFVAEIRKQMRNRHVRATKSRSKHLASLEAQVRQARLALTFHEMIRVSFEDNAGDDEEKEPDTKSLAMRNSAPPDQVDKVLKGLQALFPDLMDQAAFVLTHKLDIPLDVERFPKFAYLRKTIETSRSQLEAYEEYKAFANDPECQIIESGVNPDLLRKINGSYGLLAYISSIEENGKFENWSKLDPDWTSTDTPPSLNEKVDDDVFTGLAKNEESAAAMKADYESWLANYRAVKERLARMSDM